MIDFELSDGERAHPLWARFKAHLLDRLADARTRNDDASANEPATAMLRGRIACLKALIALGDERQAIGE
jgi:hypothetical protein